MSMPTKDNIANIEKKNGCTIGLSFHDLVSQKAIFTYKENEKRVAASGIKLFFAGAVMEAISKKDISLESSIQIKSTHLVRGTSILADLNVVEMSIYNLLYLLLAHSDTSAQNTLEQIITPEEVNNFIQRSGFSQTLFISNPTSTRTHLSLTSPSDITHFLHKLWSKELLVSEDCDLFLSFLTQTRMTHFALRNLPTSINTATPDVIKRYSKAGKIYNSINDSFILQTDRGVLGGCIFIDNFTVTEKFNSVDHKGILLLSLLTKEIFNEWYSSTTQ